jgi:hypothetical protein
MYILKQVNKILFIIILIIVNFSIILRVIYDIFILITQNKMTVINYNRKIFFNFINNSVNNFLILFIKIIM